MRIDLSGRTAVVTGSTAGIGLAVARGLAAAGARTVVNGRGQERVEAAIARIKNETGSNEVEGVAADLGSASGVAAFLKAVSTADILVNNLGIFAQQPFLEIEDEAWTRFFEVNVLSGVRMARAYAPAMRERGWGRIVFVSSESALHIPPEMVHYGMTKTAQLAVSRGLAETLVGTGVTVNAVLPGPTRSEGVGSMLDRMSEEEGKSKDEIEAGFFKTARPTSLIQRFAEVEEVANMVVYVCSPQASATTGAALRVDGGVVRAIP